MSEEVYFTSDEHHGHGKIIEFCKRPFSNTEEMTEQIVQRHNSVVKKGDIVFHLGDMFWRTLPVQEAEEILGRINGQHFYIWGNHEELLKKNQKLHRHFVWLRDAQLIHPKTYPHIHLSHYAHRVWNGSHRGNWHLYGHSHAALPQQNAGVTREESPLSMDVGVDTHDFYPWHIDEISAIMKQRNAEWKKITFVCPQCDHSFYAIDTDPKICAKCAVEMVIK